MTARTGDANAAYSGDPRDLSRWREPDDARPRVAVWEITLQCDLGCSHCGSRAGRPRRHELDTTQALDLVRQLAELGLQEVALIGGEFYLREDWDTIARAITGSGMICSLVTGARQLTDERLRRAVAAGVSKISISIDGLEATHDAIRGSRGSWAAAVSAAKRIQTAGIDLSVNTQINRLTMPELPGIADLLHEIGARSWMVILTAAMGRAADRPDLMLQPYHLLYLFPLLAKIKQERLDPKGIAFFPSNNIGYFGPLAEALRYGGDRGHSWSGCGAGATTLGIEADGSVKGCPSLPTADYVRGHAVKDGLREVSTRLKAERRSGATSTWGFCESCPHSARCRGGCTWTSHVLFGRPGNNPYCHFRALALAAEGRIETIERVSAAPGDPFDYGHHRIVENEIGTRFQTDPVIVATLASVLFGAQLDGDGFSTRAERNAWLQSAD